MQIQRSLVRAGATVVMIAAFGGAAAGAPLGQAGLPPEMLGAVFELSALTASGSTSNTLGTGITISFSADGTAGGSAGCNMFRGRYTAGANAALSFGPLAATRKACEPAINDREIAYLAALDEVTGYALDANSLMLRSGDGSIKLDYTRRAAAQLPNTGAGTGRLVLLALSAGCLAAGITVHRRARPPQRAVGCGGRRHELEEL